MSVSGVDKGTLFEVVLPCHQEFFCRIVEAYPREGDLLRSVDSSKRPYDLFEELFLLRNIGEFPIRVQMMECERPMLTARFRRCMTAIVNTLVSVIEDTSARALVASALDCPAGVCGPDKDFSCMSTQQLWCVEVARLENFVLAYGETGPELVLAKRDIETLEWLRGSVAGCLGVEVLSGSDLYDIVDAVLSFGI
ncbi:hypothetical protein VNI00_017424 [Paramarasmius palmivorus]|uniref:Uncharacterized protein n=1 Tax=Paramarasmius palmivorus TaxID=297713 RepID=A0AAW0B781_9AGAR